MAKAHYTPTNPLVLEALEQQAEALVSSLNAQGVAITLWAYATMGREPGAGVMRGPEGRAEALAVTLTAQDVANTLWAACVFSVLRAPGEEVRLVHTQRAYGAAPSGPAQEWMLECCLSVPGPSVLRVLQRGDEP